MRKLQACPWRLVTGGLALVMLAGVWSCGDKAPREGKPEIDPRDRVQANMHPVLKGTIGEFAALATMQSWRVEGFGVVAELPNTGSGEMPPNVRAMLTESLYRAGAGSASMGTQGIRPELILQSNRIAAVEVRGEIPAMAQKGSVFDLYVSSLSGTQTTSLRDGVLWTADLRINGLGDSEMQTRSMALGRGQVLTTPEVPGAKKPGEKGAGGRTTASLRKARVPGGGVVMEDMPANLQLYVPSLRISQAVQRAINARFPARPLYAQAQNESVIALRIPPDYRDTPKEFVDLVSHMYLAQETPGFTEKKAAELIRALNDPKAPHREISLCLEGLGRTIITDYLRPAYTAPVAAVRFHTARAGASLQDVQAMVILEDVALDGRSPYQREAIQTIAGIARRDRDTLRATGLMRKLLGGESTATKIMAYEALLAMRSPAVQTLSIARKYDVDLVATEGKPLIYATQTGRPRIAIFGNRLDVTPGVLFISSDNLLTINALEAEAVDAGTPAGGAGGAVLTAQQPAAATQPTRREAVHLYYRGQFGDKTTLLKCSPSVATMALKLGWVPDPLAPDYDPKAPYIGLSYQRVVETLAAMCHDQSIDANFVLQTAPVIAPTLADLVETARPEASATNPASRPATRPTGDAKKK